MKLQVNGKVIETESTTLEELVQEYQLKKEHVVAEIDGHIIERETWESVKLTEGAKVELVHFVGGG